MRFSHHKTPISRKGWHRPERGYTLAMTALLTIPMMLFAAFGVDVGSWYTRVGEIQRAVDAAALAGVVWMPNDFAQAQASALDATARNGIVNGTDGITVSVTKVPANPRELQVTITDSQVETFFGGVVKKFQTLIRSATARYVLPVPLGSPNNSFGNQNSPLNLTTDPNLWASINGPIAYYNNGDPFATKCYTNDPERSKTSRACYPSTKPDAVGGLNPNYRETGYRYAIDVPLTAVGKTLKVEVLDGIVSVTQSLITNNRCTNSAGTPVEYYYNKANINTGDGVDVFYCNKTYDRETAGATFELKEADSTPLDNFDNPTLKGRCSSGGPGLLAYPMGTLNPLKNDKWETICSMTVAKSGQYILDVRSSVLGQNYFGNGSNQYSLKATLSSNPQPQVYALDDMSIKSQGSNQEMHMYLAEIEPVHKGKVFKVDLYDPGEAQGSAIMKFVDGSGTIVKCDYTDRNGAWKLNQNCSIQTSADDDPAWYDAQWLQVKIPIPTTYSCDPTKPTPVNPANNANTGCWWRVNYTFGVGSAPQDRTTWRAQVIGDPVSLIR